jgi:2,4-dienoyl-CoA reductase-like NADH-dependent reductase (Old Yellow Enzyme family)
MALDMVFSPIRLGSVEIPNRVVRTGHGTGMTDPYASDRFIAYHTARAEGGCGLSILGAASVHPSSLIDQVVFDDACIPGFQQLTAAVKPFGMKVFQQLWHGGNLYPGVDGPPLAVSTIPGYGGIVGRPMSTGEVEAVIQAFADAALRCQKGGLDGVELHAAHGYIFHQFLTPVLNNRTDRYGGSFENRVRPLIEALLATREATGPDFCIGVRLGASESPGGVTEDEAQQVLKLLQDQGVIDFVNASKGDYYQMDTMVGSMHNPTGYELSSAGQITAVRTVPAIVAGRFRTLEEVEQVLREGTADLVSMVRAQIADPDLVRKTREGRAEEVRPCIACNQGCIGGAIRTGVIGCTVNAAVGFEASMSEHLLQRTSSPKQVLIVGGGPAGMEAARICATVGHSVILAEASPKLGGTVNLAKRAPKLSGVGDITYWLEQEVYRLGVDVRLGTYMESADVRGCSPDVVIVATGSMPRMDGHQIGDPGEPARGVEQPHVISSTDLFSTQRKLGRTALVLDTVGHYESLAVVEQLLTDGLSVTLLTNHVGMTPYVQSTWRDVTALRRFYQLGEFEVLTRHHLVEIQPGQCIVRPLQAGQNRNRAVAADTVVLVTQNEPLRALYDELRDEFPVIFLVGDALSPRDVQHAIAEGHRAARQLN